MVRFVKVVWRCDVYQTELEKAIALATHIPKVLQDRIPGFFKVGEVDTVYGKRYYYYDKSEDKYYVEGDIDREMRAAIKRNKKQKNSTSIGSGHAIRPESQM